MVKLHLMKLKMAETESTNGQNNGRGASRADRRRPTAGRPSAAARPTEVPPASAHPPRPRLGRFARGLPTPGRAAHGPLWQVVLDSVLRWNWVY